jgi:molybdopterin-guanine dinucleotide biosynthesis protein A
MRYGGRTLLQTAIGGLTWVRQIAVVGDASEIEAAAPGADIIVTREFPTFGGPAAAIAAGLDGLAANNVSLADFTMILACDMPHSADVVGLLLSALRADSDGVVAVSPDGHVQHLAGLYASVRLRGCVADHRGAGDLDGLSVRALVSGLEPDSVAAEAGSTDDVDTWMDAERLGIVPTHPFSI